MTQGHLRTTLLAGAALLWAGLAHAASPPNMLVIGTDLSPIQPTLVPRNVKFYVEDAEDEWTFDKGFDLVHGRMLAGSISDWTKFFRQAFGQLKPGGWIEMNEFEAKFYYRNENGEQSEQLNMLVKIFNKHSSDFGKGFNDVLLIPEAMRNSGFEDVEVTIQQVGTLLFSDRLFADSSGPDRHVA